jgi:hypothetical protein
MEVARRIGSETHAQVVQAREAGPAIVNEAKEHQFALLLLGLVRNTRQIPSDIDKTVAYVLANSPCRVWLVQD